MHTAFCIVPFTEFSYGVVDLCPAWRFKGINKGPQGESTQVKGILYEFLVFNLSGFGPGMAVHGFNISGN
ncbi:Hypothetical predicted protein [Olea europaea subsp. europaea]|uniref:Uncharacterized protein n=1 Tax=Olea europaea subsp. europaea TaxID=158383 RepID=A0A8S0RZZ7_OLEEU|nr:Hypothetical predicted protein [Olea europaea subsp. europaea]